MMTLITFVSFLQFIHEDVKLEEHNEAKFQVFSNS